MIGVERLALGRPPRRPGPALPAPLADVVVFCRDVLQQLPAEQHRRRRRPHRRHGAGRRLAHARGDGRPHRSRDGAARARPHGRHRGDADRAVPPGRSRAGQPGAACGWASASATVLATPALLTPEAFTRLLQPLRVLHAEWIDVRLARLTDSLSRFRETPAALADLLRRRDRRAGRARGVLPRDRPQHAHPGRLCRARRHRPDLVHRPDAARLDERLRRARSDVRVLFHAGSACPSSRRSSSRSSARRSSCCFRCRAGPSISAACAPARGFPPAPDFLDGGEFRALS